MKADRLALRSGTKGQALVALLQLLECPCLNLVLVAVGMTIVVGSIAIALVEPFLVIALELVIEAYVVDAGAALLETFCFAQIGPEDL